MPVSVLASDAVRRISPWDRLVPPRNVAVIFSESPDAGSAVTPGASGWLRVDRIGGCSSERIASTGLRTRVILPSTVRRDSERGMVIAPRHGEVGIDSA